MDIEIFKFWNIEKYAFLNVVSDDISSHSNGKEEWKENYCLFNAKQFLTGYVKGDSVLFTYKFQNLVRSFRVKFKEVNVNSAAPDKSVVSCKTFINHVKKFIEINYVDKDGNVVPKNKEPVMLINGKDMANTIKCSKNGTKISENQLMESMTIHKIAELLLTRQSNESDNSTKKELGNPATANNNDDKTLIRMMALYLSDPTFFSMVQNIESILNTKKFLDYL
ncbi:unnamed protein product [Gordionus sp. m RMFG-2023]|uniref:uncharacterized protein LOC135931070 isoform X2 n=1 Tax=Gordionus sp. m RMFG-2023 TaxID=3053472 RepID=UPI0030E04E85